MVRDNAFAGHLRNDLLAEMQHSRRRVAPSLWRNLNVVGWLVMRISYALARLLAGVLVYHREHDDI